LIHLYQRPVELAVQAQFMARCRNPARHLGIPFRNLTDEIDAGFRSAELIENGVEGAERESAVHAAARLNIRHAIIMTE